MWEDDRFWLERVVDSYMGEDGEDSGFLHGKAVDSALFSNWFIHNQFQISHCCTDYSGSKEEIPGNSVS